MQEVKKEISYLANKVEMQWDEIRKLKVRMKLREMREDIEKHRSTNMENRYVFKNIDNEMSKRISRLHETQLFAPAFLRYISRMDEWLQRIYCMKCEKFLEMIEEV